jgi:hypothetical protein
VLRAVLEDVVDCGEDLPRWNRWVPVALFPSDDGFPCISARSASTSSVSRPARHLLALQPAHSWSSLLDDPFHRRLQPGSLPSRRSDCYQPERPLPEGTCTLSRTVPSPRHTLIRALRGAGFLAPFAHKRSISSVGASGRARTTQFRRPRQHQSSCAKAWRRRTHHIPLPTFVTIAIHPSCGGGTSKKMRLICPARQPRDGAADWHDGQLVHGAYAGIARRAIDGSHWPRTLIMDVDRESHGALRAPQESRPCPR